MQIRDGEIETWSLNTRVISLGQNHGKIDATKARGAAEQLDRIAAPSLSAKNAGEGPAPGTGPAT
jgi:hypothetical protein